MDLRLGAAVAPIAPSQEIADLENGFVNPPDSARPWTWWHWMKGRVGGWLVAAAVLLFAGGQATAQPAPGPAGSTYDVRAFGAVGDGKRFDTEAINAAIRACARAGGGTVEFAPGIYLTGTIEILSNTTLHLQAGARILGSPNPGDYRSIGRATEGRSTSLIVAVKATNIAIQGPGVIDGNERAFVMQPPQPHPPTTYDLAATRQGKLFFDRGQENRDGPDRMMLDRPGVLVLFLDCRDIVMRDLTVVEAPNWCIHLACCRSALLTGLNVRNNLRIPNADAIDVSASQNVRVSDCYLEAGDDGIAVGPCADGYGQMAAENITASNCVIVSRSAGVRLGWAANDIRNLTFENLVIRNSNRGIGIFVRGREVIENVLFTNIVIETHLMDGRWWGLGEPVHISVMPFVSGSLTVLGELTPTPSLSTTNSPLGQVRNVRFVNVTATSDAPVILYSRDRGKIRNILFRNYRQRIQDSDLNRFYGGNIDLQPVTPEALGICKHDLAGFLAHGVENLELRGFDLEWLGSVPEFFTAGVEVTDFKDLVIDDFRGSGPRAGAPAMRLDAGVGEP